MARLLLACILPFRIMPLSLARTVRDKERIVLVDLSVFLSGLSTPICWRLLSGALTGLFTCGAAQLSVGTPFRKSLPRAALRLPQGSTNAQQNNQSAQHLGGTDDVWEVSRQISTKPAAR